MTPGSIPQTACKSAFTLVELLVAMSAFLVMLGFLGSILNSVFQGWETARRETEIAQNARAILNLIENDVAPTTVSRLMQFGENPAMVANLPNETLVANTDALFFWRPGTISIGTSEQVGWFLSRPKTPNPTLKGHLYDLKRYCRPTTAAEVLASGIPAGAPDSYWLPSDDLGSNTVCRVVSKCVLGFWIECVDCEGRNIPLLNVFDNNAAGLSFNSAARFQMAPPGVRFEDNSSFHYTTAGTHQADLLPASVRITILITDEATLLRFADRIPALPALPTAAANQSPPPLGPNLRAYREDLERRGIQTALFSTTINFSNVQNL